MSDVEILVTESVDERVDADARVDALLRILLPDEQGLAEWEAA